MGKHGAAMRLDPPSPLLCQSPAALPSLPSPSCLSQPSVSVSVSVSVPGAPPLAHLSHLHHQLRLDLRHLIPLSPSYRNTAHFSTGAYDVMQYQTRRSTPVASTTSHRTPVPDTA
eukprot:2199682-Rhodomonas_salina.2